MSKFFKRVYNNAVEIRRHNKSVAIVDGESGEGVYVVIRKFDPDNAESSAVSHKSIKGKVRYHHIVLSEDTLSDIVDLAISKGIVNFDELC